MKNLLKPLSLALFVAATLPTQNACNQTSPSSDPPTQNAYTQTSPPFDTIFAIGPSPYFNPPTQTAHTQTSPPSDTIPAIGPSSHFCKAIGGKDYDWGESLIQTSDGGYAIAGKTRSFGAGELDVYLVKLDANGNLQWTKTIGGKGWDAGLSLIQTSDGGYAIAGVTSLIFEGGGDVYLVKLDAKGNLQWTKTIGGPRNEIGQSLVQTSDGGYAIAGYIESFDAGGGKDVYLVKLDAHGNLQWTKTIGGKSWDEGHSLIQTSDGGYAIAGYTYSFGAGDRDVYVVKLDAKGNLQWTKTIGGGRRDGGHSLIQTSDGGYAIAGETYSFGAGESDVYVVKLDAHGNLQWTRTIGGESEDWGTSLIQTSDGGYAIAGMTNSFGSGGLDVYVVKLDAKGNLQWTKTIGGSGGEIGPSLIQTSDGGYAIAGMTNSFGLDVYVVKLDKNGDACCAVSQTSRVGSGGRLDSATPSIGSGGTLTTPPTPSTSSGGTLTNQCP
jgi:hypothetical protein